MNSSFLLTMANALAIATGFFVLFCIICFLVYRRRKFQQKCQVIESSSSLSSSLQCISSPPSRIWRHDVFPSFRGKDVRKGFLSHIQAEFKHKGIISFIDNEMKRGDSISPELLRGIRESKIAIVLLSKNYASSSWCLNELVEIMKCREEIGQTVMPVFYEVDPSDVRKQTGDFGKAFKKTCVGKTEEVKQRWRQALIDVSNIAGEDSRNWDSEASMIVKIGKDVSNMLNCTPSRDFADYVGIQSHITKVNSLLYLESSGVRMIGILGPPGIGKTTIARALYDQIFENFQFSTFIGDIGQIDFRYCHDEGWLEPPTVTMNDDRQRKINLQRRLLSEIFKQKDIVVRHLGAVQERLRNHRVLVILDGVDHVEQLDAIAKETGWFGDGSRIIITTQDQKLLKADRINDIYEVGLPTKDEALQIFCLSAFGQKFPHDDFKDLAWEVTALAGELPLGLRVLGSYLKGMSLEEWKNALPRLRTCLDGDIEKTLRFSYDALSHRDKALFLHIACLFRGYEVDHVKQWLAKCSLDVNHGLDVLRQKSLISIDMGFLKMHSLLRQLGVEIVRKSSKTPRKRQFLVDVNEISDVITDNRDTPQGTETILGIRLNVPKMEDELVVNEMVFDGMTNLQFLFVNEGYGDKLSLPRGLNCLPPKLRLLHWNYCPLRLWPSKFCVEFLVTLIMQGNKFEKLWEGIQPLTNLKRMDLRDSEDLKEIPDLSKAINLDELDLYGCKSLLELTTSIGNATKLRILTLDTCSRLKDLPLSIGNATNLQFLDLCDCSSLVRLPTSIGNATKLKRLRLRRCSLLKELPIIGSATSLIYLDLFDCKSLKELPSSIGWLVNLEELDLTRCLKLVSLPSSIGNLQKLLVLRMSGCKNLETFPTNINLESLSELDLGGCTRLKVFPDISRNIEKLDLTKTAIEEVPSSLRSWARLHRLDMSECRNLKEFPTVHDRIVELKLSKTGIEEVPPWIENLFRLRILIMYGCKKLNNISPNIAKLLNLEFLGLSICDIDRDDDGGRDNENDKEDADSFLMSSMDGCSQNYDDCDNDKGSEDADDDDEGCGVAEDVDDDDGNNEDADLEDDVDGNDAGFFDAVIEWGPDLGSWTLRSDFKVHYILPICLPEMALTSPISLCFRSYGYKTIPDCIRRLCRLRKLDIRECRKLVTLPQLPGYLLSLDAENCESLKKIACSFQNPKICLNFANCINLNQEARELIQTSVCKYAILPGVEVPAHLTHRDTSGSLTISLTPKLLPSSFRFKACILLSKGNINIEDHNDDDEEDENSFMHVSCRVRGKQNDLIVRYGSNPLHMPALIGDTEHVYIFQDSFSLNQDSPEAKEATFCELVFEFIVHDKVWNVKGCGVRLLEVPHRTVDGEETEEEICIGQKHKQ